MLVSGENMKEYHHITIGELLEIKKINKMIIREAIPKMKELKDKYKFTDKETKNLISIAKNFNPEKILL